MDGEREGGKASVVIHCVLEACILSHCCFPVCAWVCERLISEVLVYFWNCL